MTSTQILKSLRKNGLTAMSGYPKLDTPASEWTNVTLLSGRVLNVNTFSILGFGCIDNPKYDVTRKELCRKVEGVLTALGVRFHQSLPDQYIISQN